MAVRRRLKGRLRHQGAASSQGLLWLPLLQHTMLTWAVQGRVRQPGREPEGSGGLCAACHTLLVLLSAINGRSACWSSDWRSNSPMQR